MMSPLSPVERRRRVRRRRLGVVLPLSVVAFGLLGSKEALVVGSNAFAWKPKGPSFASTATAAAAAAAASPTIQRQGSQFLVLPATGRRRSADDEVFGRINPHARRRVFLRAGAFLEDSDPVDEKERSSEEIFVPSRLLTKATDFVNRNFFLVGMVVAVLLAREFPALGQNGGVLRPDLVIGNYGVTLIFLLSGLSLQTSDLAKAVANVRLNGLVQLVIFAVWPFGIGLPLRRLLTAGGGLIAPALADGLLILTTLPTTVNMCIMLTSAGGGDVASAICNAVLSNMAGIVLTPLLLVRFFGGAGNISLPFGRMVWKLCQKVLLPVMVGQALRRTPLRTFYARHSTAFKRVQEVVLLGIVWNAFCNAFADGLGLALGDSLVLLGLLSSLHLLALAMCFKFFSLAPFKFGKPEQVAASFCASQKTLAFGLPLINTIFQGDPNLAAYCAPIMFIHPLQMAIGSLLLPAIEKYASSDSNSDAVPESAGAIV